VETHFSNTGGLEISAAVERWPGAFRNAQNPEECFRLMDDSWDASGGTADSHLGYSLVSSPIIRCVNSDHPVCKLGYLSRTSIQRDGSLSQVLINRFKPESGIIMSGRSRN